MDNEQFSERSIAQSIQQIEGYENPWKLIAIAATIQACREMLSRWKSHGQYNSYSVWDRVEIIVQKDFRKLNLE
ncbi:hypothetical protein Y032_0009g622 [Ancylostoma ceylanicum]|uniref:Uncharacterized protein n=1 Tax=Ancylostoma ceylanicum TaxID=53326 RepID=A0A016VI27_9BILA|nr:hypothetical protein Y032_0009g622 [Ancylostoma ceylanicum]